MKLDCFCVTLVRLLHYFCCDNVLKILNIYQALVRARPHESVVLHDVTGLKSVTIERSPSERGGDWADDHSVETAIDKLKSLAEATVHPLSSNDDIAKSNNDGNGNVCVPARVLSEPNLPRVWPNLCVYVMSGRNHDFGSEMMNSFYNQDVSKCLLYACVEQNMCLFHLSSIRHVRV